VAGEGDDGVVLGRIRQPAPGTDRTSTVPVM